jgi:hypothetical protein
MINTKTGGPAFPRAGNEWADMAWVEAPAKDGMTLRDYFAAKAMQSILAREHGRSTTTLEFVGNHAYQYADAMLKAREA